MPITHPFVSTVTDAGDPDEVGPDEWNDEHSLPDMDELAVGLTRTVVFDDLFGVSAAHGLNGFCAITGSSGGGSQVFAAEATHWGIVSLFTGNTSAAGTSRAFNANTTSVQLGSASLRFGIIAKIHTLSDSSQRFTIRSGLSDANSGDGTNAVFFRYADDVNSGKWAAACRSGATETSIDTGVTADTNWHRWEFVVDSAATEVEFFIDGTSVGTITSNIPTGGTSFLPGMIQKSVGTSGRNFHIDAYWYVITFASSRV